MAESAATLPDTGIAFLHDLRAAFDRAAADGVVERTYRIAGRPVRLRIAGDVLDARITPALAHLAAPIPEGAALTVRMWDSGATGVRPPAPPWPADAYRERCEIRHDYDFRAAFNMMSGVLSVLEAGDTEATVWVRDAAALPLWETAAPLRALLGWWAPAVGGQLAHGAAVGTKQGGVILAAIGGSGKSTTALSCLDAGLLYAGDDYVMIEGGASPTIHSLYASAKLVPANLEARLPHLAALAQASGVEAPGDNPFDKVVMLLQDHFPEQMAAQLPLRAVVVPHIDPDGPSLAPLSARDVLRALAPTTVFQLPGAGGDSLDLLSGIVETVPGYALGVGPDLDANVAAIRALIDREAHA
ncbi:MAG: hypothetical protein AAF845_10590 [Bacteroidota bacterium]